jgi:hypothetical protein
VGGELYRNDTTTLLATRELDWQDFEGVHGHKIKVLNRFRDGRPSVFLLWLPPGAAPYDGPHRHYHRTVDEHHFVLEGEQPTWIYDGPEQGEGEGHAFVLREGFYLGRTAGPSGIHGRETQPTSETGCVMLVWRTGPGNFTNEPEDAEETVVVPYP